MLHLQNHTHLNIHQKDELNLRTDKRAIILRGTPGGIVNAGGIICN